MTEKKEKYGTIYLMQIPERLCYADLESGMSALSENRQQKIRRYMIEDSKILSFCCAFLVRAILQRDFDMKSVQIHVDYLKGGKPVLTDKRGHIIQPHISWSHSKKAVAMAVSREPVGVDIEWIGRYRENIARKNFSKEEWGYLEKSEQKEQEFYKLWTRKEAFVKRSGEGLRKDLSKIPTYTKDMESIIWENYMISVCSDAGVENWNYCIEEWDDIYKYYSVSPNLDR